VNYRGKLFDGKWVDYCHPSDALFLLLNNKFSYTEFWNACSVGHTSYDYPVLVYVSEVGASSIVRALC